MGLPHHSAQGLTSSNSFYWFHLSEKAHSCSACQLWYRVAFRWKSVWNKINKWFVRVKSPFLTLRPELQWHNKYYICLALSHLFRDRIRLQEVTWVLHALTLHIWDVVIQIWPIQCAETSLLAPVSTVKITSLMLSNCLNFCYLDRSVPLWNNFFSECVFLSTKIYCTYIMKNQVREF